MVSSHAPYISFLQGCEVLILAVHLSGYSITFLGEVIACNKEEGWRDILSLTEGFSVECKKWKTLNSEYRCFHIMHILAALAF